MYQGKNIVAVELAGGRGSRLYPIVAEGIQSKATLPIAGKRLAYFNADLVETAGIPNLIIPVEFNKDEIKKVLDFPGYSFEWAFVEPDQQYFHRDEQPRFRGTADAVWQHRNQQAVSNSDYSLVMPCDHITNVNLQELVLRAIFNAEKYDAVITVAVMEMDEKNIKKTLGNPKLGENGQVIDWIEKPEVPISNFASLGIYAGPTAAILQAIERGGYDFGHDVLPFLMPQGKLFAHSYNGNENFWTDVGKPDLLLQAARDLRKGVKGIRVPYRKVELETTPFGGTIEDCLVAANGKEPKIWGTVKRSSIGDDSIVTKGASVEDSMLMGSNKVVRAKRNTAVVGSILGKCASVSDTYLDKVALGKEVEIHNCDVAPGMGIRVYPDAKLYNYRKGAKKEIKDHVLGNWEGLQLEEW